MNFSYFRKSHRTYEETLTALRETVGKGAFTLIGEIELSDNKGVMFLISKTAWLDKLLTLDHRLLGLMPFSLSVLKKEGDILVGTGQTQLLKALGAGGEMAELANTTEAELKELVHTAANVGEPKLESVKLFSSMSCPYCKMEEKWLKDKNIEHKMVLVDVNQDEAEYLVKQTGQLGVPVTEIKYEESDPEYIIGFDQKRLSDLLLNKKESLLIMP